MMESRSVASEPARLTVSVPLKWGESGSVMVALPAISDGVGPSV